jgi:hypothetical protein
MAAANVQMEIDQGEDFTSSIIYTDDNDQPYNVIAPCRLDIKSRFGATQISLTTPVGAVPDGTIPEIGLSSEVGIIQLHIEDTVTAALIPGVYIYDLFVTVNDGNAYAGNQVQRLIQGECIVNQRVTHL